MALKITSEKYNGLPALYANAGEWVDCEITLRNSYHVGSGSNAPISSLGTILTFPNVQWGQNGFVAGDVVTIKFYNYSLGASIITYTRTITYVNGNELHIDTPLPGAVYNAGIDFPNGSNLSGMFVDAVKLPQQIDFIFNLTKNGISSPNSILDGEINRFMYNETNTMITVGDTATMVQLGNKSGGMMTIPEIERLADTTDAFNTFSNWKITFKFLQWGIFENNTVYGASNCLVPYVKGTSYSLVGNPNGILSDIGGATQSNTGFFDENYNGQPNNYSFQSIQWTDSLGNTIDKMDFSADSNFIATFTAPNQLNGTSKYNIGLAFRPADDALYKNKFTSAFDNLLVNAPDVDFLHSATPSATVYNGFANVQGVQIDLTNLQFYHSGGTLTVSGTTQPNSTAYNFFSNLPDGERNMVIWVRISNHSTSGSLSDEVNLLCFNDDNYDAPTIGVQYPYIVDETLFDHAGMDITPIVTPNTTTEDDVLYISNIMLNRNEQLDGIRLSISMRNDVTDESFSLENSLFSFVGVPYIGGVYQLNLSQPRNFNLPLTTDRNAININLNPALDDLTQYGVQIQYGFLNDWRYWKQLLNANDAFFNMTEPNNGLNRDWQHYLNGDWYASIDTYVIKNGVEDFNHFEFKIRNYEDDPQVTATSLLTDSLGNNPTNLLANEIHELKVGFDWANAFTDEWVEFTIEDFEGGNRWVASSVLDLEQTGANPFKPLAGETKIKLTNLGTILTAECLIDTNVVNAQKVSLSYRVYASPREMVGYIISYKKDAELAYSIARKISNDSVYDGALIRVRRDSDDEEMDITHLNSELDVDTLLDFVGAGNGYVTKIYDQAGAGCHAYQNNTTKQGLIVESGVLITSNGLPALKLNNTAPYTHYNLTYNVINSGLVYQTWVFERNDTGGVLALGGGVSAGNDEEYFTGGVISYGSGDVISRLNPSVVNYGIDDTLGHELISIQNDGTNTEAFINGVSYSTVFDPFTSVIQFNRLLASDIFNGTDNFQELIYWRKNKTAERTAIEQNIINYYGL